MKQSIHVWAAKFESLERRNEFFEEQYEDDDRSISPFGESQNEGFYDHDFFYIGGVSSGPGREILSYGKSKVCAEEVTEAWSKVVPAELKTILIAPGEEFKKPSSHSSEGVDIVYVGLFK